MTFLPPGGKAHPTPQQPLAQRCGPADFRGRNCSWSTSAAPAIAGPRSPSQRPRWRRRAAWSGPAPVGVPRPRAPARVTQRASRSRTAGTRPGAARPAATIRHSAELDPEARQSAQARPGIACCRTGSRYCRAAAQYLAPVPHRILCPGDATQCFRTEARLMYSTSRTHVEE